jgi:hypothetical protein
MMKKEIIYCFLIIFVLFEINSETTKNNTLAKYYLNKNYFVDSNDWAEIKFKEYVLSNNVWGKKNIKNYEQCIFLNKKIELYGWAWEWPDIGNNVRAYPEIIYGKKPWADFSTIKELPSRINTYDFIIQYEFELNASGEYNTAFDIFLTNSKDSSPESITHEIMIWVTNSEMSPTGFQPNEIFYLNNKEISLYVKKSLEVGDYSYDYLCFKYSANIHKGKINLSFFINHLLELGLINKDLFIASIEFGNEVVKGQGEMIIKKYNISIKNKQ